MYALCVRFGTVPWCCKTSVIGLLQRACPPAAAAAAAAASSAPALLPAPPPGCVQSAVRLRGSPVVPATVLDVSGAVPASAVQGLLAAARTGQFARVQAAVTDLIADGYPAQEILLQLQTALLEDGDAADSGAWTAED